MATLKDVARLANVDVSTVSRALNNTSYVHPETKARILQAVEELCYEPNLIAKGLRQGKRNTIGVVLPKLTFSIFSEIASSIEKQARSKGYATLICDTGNDETVEKESLNRLRNGFIDGLIIAGTGHNKRLIRDIHASGIPVVQVIRELDITLTSVVVNYRHIGYAAVEHLVSKGCKEIGLINGSIEITPYQQRFEGYKEAIRDHHLSPITVELEAKLRGMQYGYDCTEKLLDQNGKLDAILAATDAQGMGVIRALKDNQLSCPNDIKVLSMTGHRVGSMLETSLTSMELPGVEIGTKAAELVLKAIESLEYRKAIQHLRLSATLVERESTK